jgi:predicted RNase H-like HicB family nuclease
MLEGYTAVFTPITSGYMGQLVEWPEVITEGETIEDCREMLQDALDEMIAANQQMSRRADDARKPTPSERNNC